MQSIQTPMFIVPAFLTKNLILVIAIVLLVILTVPLQAVIINGGDGTGNNSAPTDAFGDPGWANVGTGPYSNVYLGNGWVLEAYHCHTDSGNVDYARINGVTYNGIPGSGIRLNDPSTNVPADLYLYQISGNTGLPSLAISVTTPTKNSTVRAIGSGVDRVNATTPTLWDSNWNVLPPGTSNPTYSGFYYGTSYTKRWGDNNISGTFIQNDWSYGATHWVYTTFNQTGGNNEFQVSPGDSGGGLFLKNNGFWQLAGILDAMGGDQPPVGGVTYGNQSFAADLSYYRSQIVSAVQVFQISSMLGNPSAAIGTGWTRVQLIGDAGFGPSSFSWSIPIDTNSFNFTVDTGPSTDILSGVISSSTGNGGLIKNGTGTLVLSALNTYTGSTTINAGIVQISNSNNCLPSGTAVALANFAGAALNVNNFTQTIGSLSGGGNLGGNVTLGSGTLLVGDNSSTTYSGVISGTGKLVKTGPGTLSLNGVNTYTGQTSINGGILSFARGALDKTSQVTFTGDATLQWNGHNQDISGRLTINDGVKATLDTNGNDVIFNLPLNFGTAQTGALIKAGAGSLTLVGSLSSASNTTILGGLLNVGDLHTPNATVTVFGTSSALLATSIEAKSLIVGFPPPLNDFASSFSPQDVASIPEPSTLALLMLAFCSLGVVRRFRSIRL